MCSAPTEAKNVPPFKTDHVLAKIAPSEWALDLIGFLIHIDSPPVDLRANLTWLYGFSAPVYQRGFAIEHFGEFR